MSKSKVLSYIAKKLPGLMSREAVETLVASNELSWESANAIITNIDMQARAVESEGAVKHVDIANSSKMDIAKDATAHHFANIKFEALLQKIQEDDTLQYDEFVKLDNERNKIVADIINKHEADLNIMLNQIKTTGGINADAVDALIQTKLGVAAID